MGKLAGEVKPTCRTSLEKGAEAGALWALLVRRPREHIVHREGSVAVQELADLARAAAGSGLTLE